MAIEREREREERGREEEEEERERGGGEEKLYNGLTNLTGNTILSNLASKTPYHPFCFDSLIYIYEYKQLHNTHR